MENITKLSDRIKYFIDYKCISINKFSLSVGASNSYFNKILKDNNSIGSDRIEKILRTYPEMNPEWLLTGKGEMLKDSYPIRLQKIIDHTGLSVERFRKTIDSPQLLFDDVLAGKYKLANKTLTKIAENYPEFNLDWLLTGQGEMLKKENTTPTNGIEINPINLNRKTQDPIKVIQEVPLYDLSATAGLVEVFKGTQRHVMVDTLKIPGIASCDGAIYVTGDSMYPLLKSGDIVMYKQIELDKLFWGEMYLLSVQIDEWNDYITVKFVQKSEFGEDYIKLVSQNQHHQPKDILIKDIRALALIRASIRLH
ncbi:S24 family peptidase [Apibacter muscae]|uniref:S24 family peptidase n=1 Tax=Apibacter muscae TaxID=2509004 RepID=UPI001FE55C62|nr:S24 family peptidase [Apibacter muscae]